MNFAALLAVVAAAAFVLPLVVRGAEAVGLSRGLGVAVSLAMALGLAAAWAVKQRAARPAARREERGSTSSPRHSGRPGISPNSAVTSHRSEGEEAVDASL